MPAIRVLGVVSFADYNSTMMTASSRPDSTPFHRWRTVIFIVAALALLGIAAMGWRLTHQPLAVPTKVAEKVLFPIYLPTTLPRGYAIDPDSYDTKQNVLIFTASDDSGNKLTFSEQPKPPDFDIGIFHEKSLKNSKSLPGTPYPSVVGQTETGGRLLSVLTDNTWVLVTTKSAQAEANLKHVAERLKQQ